jgi:hypothetical protein
MTPNMRALDIKRPGFEEQEVLLPEVPTMTRKVETVMPLEQYQQMQMGSPSEVPEEMLDPEMLRRMGM